MILSTGQELFARNKLRNEAKRLRLGLNYELNFQY